MFHQQFPDVIEIILIFSQRFKDVVFEINKVVVKLVLEIMKDKNDFENIIKKLKNEFKGDKNQLHFQDQANTKEIVVNWYIVLFNNFDNDLVDSHKDIFITWFSFGIT